MVKKTIVSYDDFSDRLLISNKSPEQTVKGSARILNLTIDFTTDNKMVGVEIKNASQHPLTYLLSILSLKGNEI